MFKNPFRRKEKKKESLLRSTLSLMGAIAIALALRSFLFEPFRIPSPSMVPTLLVGDFLFISKYPYGYSRHSFPFGRIILPDFGRVWQDEPKRGDVVVFRTPEDDKTDYIKRLVGLPGDKIQVIGGILHINGEAVKRQAIGQKDGFTLYHETIPRKDGTTQTHLIQEINDNQGNDNTPLYHVPQGHYFMMGDNRDQSLDSRYTRRVGYVPAENLLGQAEIIHISFNWDKIDDWWKVWQWFTAIRYDRFFHGIE